MRTKIMRAGFSLAAELTGAAVVMLSNSLGTTRQMWDAQAEMLGESHRVIRYDTRGHGASETPAGPYVMQDFVEDAIAVLDHFNVERADFVGLSLGGMTGLGLALSAPSRLNRLVVSAARADAPPPVVEGWDRRINLIRAGGVADIWQGSLGVWLTPEFVASEPGRVAALQARFLETTDDGYLGCAAALKSLDYLRHLHEITTPVLYISGENDVGAAPDVMAHMAAATPKARHVNVPGAGHLININAPGAYNDAIRDFLV